MSILIARYAIALLVAFTAIRSVDAQPLPKSLNTFFANYCNDCHADGAAEGGLRLDELSRDIEDPATFATWERIYDRVRLGEMPPKDAEAPSEKHKQTFAQLVHAPLNAAHAARKGTVLRRLNRREYENTLNDLFGVNANLAEMLPEDGRSHEFDNVGDSLGLSMVHLQQYLNAIDVVLDEAVVNRIEPPTPRKWEASYLGTPEAERFVGKVWKKLDDGAVVRFSRAGYPSGMIRGTGVRERGRYRIRVTGYAHQSSKPITFSVGGTSFAPGSEKPIYGFYSFKPGQPQTVELETWIENRYMLQIEPFGIVDRERYQRKSIKDYKGPGLAILNVAMEGPLTDQYPTTGHQLIFSGLNRKEIMPRNPRDRTRKYYQPKFEMALEDEKADIQRSLIRVANAAFRRPAGETDVAPFMKLYFHERAAQSTQEESLRTAVRAIFCSTSFLYLNENAGRLDDYALASRLSYFLTRTAPDAELLRAAKEGKLRESEELRRQTERLLNAPRSDRFINDFTDAWLDLREMDFTAPDSKLFPEFDPYLRDSMPKETRAFVRELIDSNLPISHLVKSPFAMLNSRLADHYGIRGVDGAELRKVALPDDSLRGGLLTQGSILKVTANGTNTSPVTRGAWVMERILGETPPPPPAGVAGVEPDIRGASTLRELLAKHRDLPSCNACHQNIDPPGFALECFNPIGGHRERYRSIGGGERIDLEVNGRRVAYRLGLEVDSSGQTADGKPFKGFRDFRDHLASQPETLARSLASKLLTFACGRELGFSDRAELDAIVKRSGDQGNRVRDLIHQAVQSEIFRNK